jgi:hypothetical protein
VQSGHIHAVEDYLLRHVGSKFTLNDINAWVRKEHSSLVEISRGSIRKILHATLRYSYKKVSKLPLRSLTPDNERRYFESAAVLDCLKSQGWELVYVDEFKVKSGSEDHYLWGLRGMQGFLSIPSDDFSMSFVAALSERHFYGVMATDGTVTSSVFMRFIEKFLKWLL